MSGGRVGPGVGHNRRMTRLIALDAVPGAPAGSTRLRGYLSTPPGPGPWPGVVVIHEIVSVDDVMRRQVDRLAEAGYLALMPDLFSDGGARRCLLATFRAMSSGHGRAYADIEAARTFLADHADSTGRVGIIGFCMGGAFALMCATRGFDVAGDNYGMAPKDVALTLHGACPVIASYGGRDRLLGTKVAGRLAAGLDRAGVEHQVHVYPDAGHQFLNDAPSGPAVLGPFLRVANAGPEPASAVVAWARIEAFFAEHLGPR